MFLHPNWDFSCTDQLVTWGRYLLLRIFVALLIQPELEDLRLASLGRPPVGLRDCSTAGGNVRFLAGMGGSRPFGYSTLSA